MKLKIKTDEKGVCKCFKIDDKDYGVGIHAVDIHIEAGRLPKVVITGDSNEFILDSENNKLYLKKEK